MGVWCGWCVMWDVEDVERRRIRTRRRVESVGGVESVGVESVEWNVGFGDNCVGVECEYGGVVV